MRSEEEKNGLTTTSQPPYLIRMQGDEDRNGNILQSLVERSFQTGNRFDLDNEPVQFSLAGTDVSLDSPIQIESPEPINGALFLEQVRFRDVTGNAFPAFDVQFSEDHRILQIIPIEPLLPNRSYQVLFDRSSPGNPPVLRDLGDNQLGTTVYSFSTAP